jgi:very-short-patch-repair endonuclease
MQNKIIPYNPKLKDLARKLRKESTLSEVLLWKKIKGKALGIEFHRQVPIDEFIVDFYCHELRLAIEIDGCSHDEKFEYDLKRQEKLESLGVGFLRFNDMDVKRDMYKVIRAIEDRIADGINIPLPPSKGELNIPLPLSKGDLSLIN